MNNWCTFAIFLFALVCTLVFEPIFSGLTDFRKFNFSTVGAPLTLTNKYDASHLRWDNASSTSTSALNSSYRNIVPQFRICPGPEPWNVSATWPHRQLIVKENATLVFYEASVESSRFGVRIAVLCRLEKRPPKA